MQVELEHLRDGPAGGCRHALPVGFAAGLMDEVIAVAQHVAGLVVVVDEDRLLQREQVGASSVNPAASTG